MGAVTLALMAFFAFLIVRATAPQMTPLFTDLSVEDSSAIIKDLERQGIPYDIKNDGAIVLVPKEQIPRLRMKLAEGGLPKGGGVGYEIFDKSDALGATSFVQNINHLRALEGELVAHHPRHRPRAAGARASRAAGAAAVLARQGRAVGLDRAQGARHARSAAGAGDPPSRRQRRQRAEAAARLGGRRDRPAAGRRQRRRHRRRRDRRRAQARLRAPHARADRIASSPRWSARAAPACSSPPNSISTASPRPPTVRSGEPRGALEPDPRGGHGQRRHQRRRRSPSATNCPAATCGPTAQQAAARPEPQDRGNRQLRDFPHHQDRSDRGRPDQPHLGRGRGRRHLRQERQGRDSPTSRAARKRSTASPRWCAPPSASTRSAATRSRSPTCGSPKRRSFPIGRADRLDEHAAIHQGRHHARRRARRDGAARAARAAARSCAR